MELITRETQGLTPLSPNIQGKVVVVNYQRLDRNHHQPRFQLLKVTGGFGTQSGALGQSVFGVHIADGRDGQFARNDIIGEATRHLIDRAMSDNRPVAEFDPSERVYMLVTKDGVRTRGDTVEAAMQRLRRITQSPVLMAYRMHPASKISPLGYISYPDGAPPELVEIKKVQEVWTAIN